MNQPDAKKWFIKCIFTLVVLLTFIALVVIIVDPYFHYHKPFSFLSYRLYEERYTNDGISRQFDFDAMITGSSITQNFKTSEMDALFGTNSVKESFSGAGYKELADNLDRALSRNKNLKMVLWAVDYNGFLRKYDWARYEEYPTYLYDDNLLNDVSYLFNKSILYHGVLTNIAMTLTQTPSTTMDEYSSWGMETGFEVVMASYDRDKLDMEDHVDFGEGEYNIVTQTITSNILRVVNKYPDTTFYIFYPPFSIFYWDSLNIAGTLDRQLQAEQVATRLLLECPNVKLYNFFDQYEVICNADYYSDAGHYCEDINSRILQWIAEDTGLITKENYMEKLDQERNFYENFDYDSFFSNYGRAIY